MNGTACTTIDAIPDPATAFPVTDLPAPLARLDRITLPARCKLADVLITNLRPHTIPGNQIRQELDGL